MHKLHSELQRFTYNAGELFTRNSGRITKFRETSNSKLIFKNKLDEACFHHDTSYYDNEKVRMRTTYAEISKD